MRSAFLVAGTMAFSSVVGACSAPGEDDENMNELQGAAGGNSAAGAGFGSGGRASGSGGFVAASGGYVGSPGAGGRIASAGSSNSGGMTGAAGTVGMAGMVGSAGTASASGGATASGGADGSAGVVDQGSGGSSGTATCCPSGDCLCHGPDPSGLTARSGPFSTDSYRVSDGTIYYPTDADPPFAAVAIIPGFTNTGPEMAPWGPFYASHGIVMIAVTAGALDQPATRGRRLLAGVEALKAENSNSSGELSGKLSGRYGTSGYSMGGGGTTIASGDDSTLKTSVGLAAYGPQTSRVQVPTLLLCGSSDGTAPCSTSRRAYDSLPDSTPKMMVTISGASHFSWFSPTSAGGGVSGETALAFQKVFLEGDERWRPLLLDSRGTVTTNIQ